MRWGGGTSGVGLRCVRAPRGLAGVLVTWLVLGVAGCQAERAPFWQNATGERVRHMATEVPDLWAHRMEISEFVFEGTERAASQESRYVQRVVLVTDLHDWQRNKGNGNVHGYAERTYRGGLRMLYRVSGRALRTTLVENSTVTVFDLTALYTRGNAWQVGQPVGGIRYTVPFRLRVDEETGAAEITKRDGPLHPM